MLGVVRNTSTTTGLRAEPRRLHDIPRWATQKSPRLLGLHKSPRTCTIHHAHVHVHVISDPNSQKLFLDHSSDFRFQIPKPAGSEINGQISDFKFQKPPSLESASPSEIVRGRTEAAEMCLAVFKRGRRHFTVHTTDYGFGQIPYFKIQFVTGVLGPSHPIRLQPVTCQGPHRNHSEQLPNSRSTCHIQCY